MADENKPQEDNTQNSEVLSQLVDTAVDTFQEGVSTEDKAQLRNNVIDKAIQKAQESGMSAENITKIKLVLQEVLNDNTIIDTNSIETFKEELSTKLFQSVTLQINTEQSIQTTQENTQAPVQNENEQDNIVPDDTQAQNVLNNETVTLNVPQPVIIVEQSQNNSTAQTTPNLSQANRTEDKYVESSFSLSLNTNKLEIVNKFEDTEEPVQKEEVLVKDEPPQVEEKEVIVDNTPPIAPIIIFNDIGDSHSDGITSNNSVTVLGLESNATWQYSIDGGTTWNTGTASTFDVDTDGTYNAGDIQVKQTDQAGNESEVGSSTSSMTFDTVGEDSPVTFDLATDTGSSNSDNITNDATVNINVTSLLVTGWEYSIDGGSTWDTGIGSSFELSTEKTYAINDIQVRTKGTTDTAGNASTAIKNSSAITFDETGPSSQTLSLATDTGSSATDNITNDATINVSGLESGATWQYSTDGGSSWSNGSGTSFELSTDNVYNAGDIKVKQTDVAGNVGTAVSNTSAITLDTTGDGTSSTLSLNTDSGTSNSDNITSNGQIDVTFNSSVTSWEYSSDGGTTWSDGTGTGTSVNFTLAEGTYDQNDIQIREKGVAQDTAGNAGNVSKNSNAITVDTTASSITVSSVAISADSGASSSDFVTKTASQTISATLSTALSSDDKLYGSFNNGRSWIDISNKVTDTAISWDGAILNGNSSIKFKIKDLAGNETGSLASTSYTFDATAPTTTITDATYDAANNKITLTGTNFNTLLESSEDATTDIKDRLDWSKMSWVVNGNGSSESVSFANEYFDSAKVVSSTTLEIIAKDASAAFIEGPEQYDPLDTDDVLEVTAGFTKDSAGNASTTDAFKTSYGPDTSIVVFDFVGGTSSNHSSRTFDANTSYTIYLRVDSDSITLNTDANSGNGTWGLWTGAVNLRSDDKIILVGDGSAVIGKLGNSMVNTNTDITNGVIKWITSANKQSRAALSLYSTFGVVRQYSGTGWGNTVNIFADRWGSNPNGGVTKNIDAGLYLTTMPNGVMTSQGLA